jgi:integrase
MAAAARVFRPEPIRNRLMLALAYDSALRREELRSLRTDDLDPAHRTLRVRAETTKTRRERIVPYSASTGVLLADYCGTGARSAEPGVLDDAPSDRADQAPTAAHATLLRCLRRSTRQRLARQHAHTR